MQGVECRGVLVDGVLARAAQHTPRRGGCPCACVARGRGRAPIEEFDTHATGCAPGGCPAGIWLRRGVVPERPWWYNDDDDLDCRLLHNFTTYMHVRAQPWFGGRGGGGRGGGQPAGQQMVQTGRACCVVTLSM